jgi:hypothetical protein
VPASLVLGFLQVPQNARAVGRPNGTLCLLPCHWSKFGDGESLDNAPPPTVFPKPHKKWKGCVMTIEQFEKMSPQWIKRTIQIDLVSSSGETFAGPRLDEVTRNGMVLEYSCGPWWFPRNLLITHLNWVDIKDSTVFHRTRLDPGLKGEAGEYFTLDAALRFNTSKNHIENILGDHLVVSGTP